MTDNFNQLVLLIIIVLSFKSERTTKYECIYKIRFLSLILIGLKTVVSNIVNVKSLLRNYVTQYEALHIGELE